MVFDVSDLVAKDGFDLVGRQFVDEPIRQPM